MTLLAFSSGDLWRVALAVFLVAVGLTAGYFLLRLGETAKRASSLITGIEKSVIPVIGKAGGSLDRINQQLDKVDQITDSAVDAADSADTAVRAITTAIVRPVQKVSGLAAAITYGAADFRAHHSLRAAVAAGREAAARRERELVEELRATERSTA
ncbi:MAG TPA: DUF948 domain-containing protein [Gaiellaceae bacterium]|jgi:hypothetical protein